MFKKSFKRFLNIDYNFVLSSDSSEDENPGGSKKVMKLGIGRKVKRNDSYSGEKERNSRNLNEGTENNIQDFSKYMEICTNNFDKIQNKKKDLLTKFTETIADVYQSEFGEMLRRQEEEVETFKSKFLGEVTAELDDWDKQIVLMKQQEAEVLKLLEQLQAIYNISEIENRRVKIIAEMHKNFIQKYDELIRKHKVEAQAAREVVNKQILKEKAKLLSNLETEETSSLGEPFTSSHFAKLKYT